MSAIATCDGCGKSMSMRFLGGDKWQLPDYWSMKRLDSDHARPNAVNIEQAFSRVIVCSDACIALVEDRIKARA